MDIFRSGKKGGTTEIGYVNKNKQKCCGQHGVAGTDYGQLAYRMECLECGYVYGTNGSDIFERKCPKCQGEAAGIDF